MESSCVLHSTLPQILSPLPFTSSLYLSSRSPFFYFRNPDGFKRRIKLPLPMASSLRHEKSFQKPEEAFKRRALLLFGVSLFPIFQSKDEGLEAIASGEDKQRGLEEYPKAEQVLRRDPPSNPFLALLNALGIIGAGVFSALFALARKDKATSQATIESLESQLKEKDAAIVSLEKKFESKLLHEQEEWKKQLAKAKEERLSLMNLLESANSTITGLGHELQDEKKKIQELEVQISCLQTDNAKAGEDKRVLEEQLKEKNETIAALQERMNLLSADVKDKENAIRGLNASFMQKDLDLQNLISTYSQTKDELAEMSSEMAHLKEELLKNQNELEQKSSVVDDMNTRINSLIGEREDLKRSLNALQEDYNDLKLSSERKVTSDAKFMGDLQHELHQLKEKYQLTQSEASTNKMLISDLTQERDELKKMLDIEAKNVENLKQELHLMQEYVVTSRNEAADLSKQLKQSKDLCSNLEDELSSVQAEFSQTRESLQRSLEAAKSNSDALSSELAAAKTVLKKTKDEVQTLSKELTSVSQSRDDLKKELIDVYKKAESASYSLQEEQKMVASLNTELQALERQISKDREARKSLETDLDEATKALDEMTKSALMLSRELEIANSRVSSHEEERDFLSRSLEEQKKISQEAKDNLEDAHNMVMRLGSERESLDSRTRELEDELASLKSEILRLNGQLNANRAVVNSQTQKKTEPGVTTATPLPVKKNFRRRRGDTR
ncbi:MAR-binding filament-like protein [Ancistrocladus abbreviatus]